MMWIAQNSPSEYESLCRMSLLEYFMLADKMIGEVNQQLKASSKSVKRKS